MKTLLLLILILLPCEIGAQEGCGEWVKTNLLLNNRELIHQFLNHDSVWIPKLCPERTIEEDYFFYLDMEFQNPSPFIEKWTIEEWQNFILDGIRDSVIGLIDPPGPCVRDTVRRMTVEEKVDMLFDMVLSLTAEINCLKSKLNK